MKAVLASKNPHKLAEIQAILSGLGVEVVMESELGLDIDVDETGTTFEGKFPPQGRGGHARGKYACHRGRFRADGGRAGRRAGRAFPRATARRATTERTTSASRSCSKT